MTAAKLCCLAALCALLLLESLLTVSAGSVAPPPITIAKTHTSALRMLKTVSSPPVLSSNYYLQKCPAAEGIIHNKVRAWVKKDPTLAPALIRLHFHDCAVRGCDGSILLNHRGSERRAIASRTLRGFQVIDDIKSHLESACPRTVSCADILTAATRDATVALGGPFWTVDFGRKDGKISISREADTVVPQGHENVTALIDFFQARGLTLLDLVVLSGSHTIGRTACASVMNRLRKPDPRSLDPGYFRNLTRACKPGHGKGRLRRYVNLDVTTPFRFDAEYYGNLGKRLGLLKTDQLMYSDKRTAPFVSTLATQPGLFESQFAVSMVKLGNVLEKRGGGEGEIRWNCNYVNPSSSGRRH